MLPESGGTSSTSSTVLPPEFADLRVVSAPYPTALAFTPDGRLLIASLTGQLRVYESGTLLESPALDLTLDGRLCFDGERGLLGVAVDPEFATNGLIYLYYSANASLGCGNRVSRFTLSADNVASDELVLVDNIPTLGGHNGGDLHFGKDGLLYVSVGDGSCDYAGDSGCGGSNDASRDLHALVGKILRIGKDGSIPSTNPFVGSDSERCHLTGRTEPGKKCRETFAWGLRNPFRMAFEPNTADTRFYVNDVGQNTWEEIDLGLAGADYGWNKREGPCRRGSQTYCGEPKGMTNPVYAYSHDTGCESITGGAFVPSGVWPAA